MKLTLPTFQVCLLIRFFHYLTMLNSKYNVFPPSLFNLVFCLTQAQNSVSQQPVQQWLDLLWKHHRRITEWVKMCGYMCMCVCLQSSYLHFNLFEMDFPPLLEEKKRKSMFNPASNAVIGSSAFIR